jgi:cell wall-associated NlpC family hydrolase
MPSRLRRLLPALAPAATAAVVLALGPVPVGVPAAHAGEPRPVPPVTDRPDARPPVPRPPTKGQRAARIAVEVVGVPYRWGGESPASGFDCSGLVRWAYGRVGIDLPHNSYALYSVGRRVPRDDLEAGDVLFFEGLGHVGLYLGEGRMVHAPQTGRNVEVVRLATTSYGSRLIGARRMAAA